MVDSNLLKELREATGAGMSDIKSALDESNGDREKAIEILRKKGQSKMAKKGDRVAKDGIIESYIHSGGRIGVIVELNSETDFVARTDEFKLLAKEIAMHIAAANPLYVSREDVPEEVLAKEREIYREQAKDSGKPAEIVEKMIEGKVAKYLEEVCLLDQPFFREPEKKVGIVISDSVAKMGEKVVVGRFARYQLGA
jgi:elongation factor Ts